MKNIFGILLEKKNTGRHSAFGNVSGYRCVSDCRSRGCKFDHSRVPYFCGDWSWNNFYCHSPLSCWIIQEGSLSVTSENISMKYWLTFKLAQEKVWLGELTIPPWPILLEKKIPGGIAHSVTCLATDACLTADPGVASLITAGSHTFVEIDHEIISTVILLSPAESFKKVRCQLQAKILAWSTG